MNPIEVNTLVRVVIDGDGNPICLTCAKPIGPQLKNIISLDLAYQSHQYFAFCKECADAIQDQSQKNREVDRSNPDHTAN